MLVDERRLVVRYIETTRPNRIDGLASNQYCKSTYNSSGKCVGYIYYSLYDMKGLTQIIVP